MLYMMFSSSVIGAIRPSYFLGSEGHSLATVLAQAFPRFKVVSKVIYLGGLFAIIGTLHAMIWSVSVLLYDVLQKSKNNKVLALIKQKKLRANHGILLSSLLIMFSSFFLKSQSIMNLSVLLIATSYVLSIVALFNEKSHRAICTIGIFGGTLMGAFSLYYFIRG